MLLKTNEFSNVTETVLAFYHFLSFLTLYHFYYKIIAFVFLVPCMRINILLYACLLITFTLEWVFIKTVLPIYWNSIDKRPSMIVRFRSSLLQLVLILVPFPKLLSLKPIFFKSLWVTRFIFNCKICFQLSKNRRQ